MADRPDEGVIRCFGRLEILNGVALQADVDRDLDKKCDGRSQFQVFIPAFRAAGRCCCGSRKSQHPNQQDDQRADEEYPYSGKWNQLKALTQKISDVMKRCHNWSPAAAVD